MGVHNSSHFMLIIGSLSVLLLQQSFTASAFLSSSSPQKNAVATQRARGNQECCYSNTRILASTTLLRRRMSSPLFMARYRPNSNVPGGGGGNGKNNNNNNKKNNKDDPIQKRQRERNWIEKSSPTGLSGLGVSTSSSSGSSSNGIGGDDVEEYTLKLHGPTFQIGPLSKRFYDALMGNALKRFGSKSQIPSDLIPIYKSYALDMAAKEAVKAALQENGLEMVETVDLEDSSETGMPGTWGTLEAIEILENDNPKEDDIVLARADQTEYVVREQIWEPGQAYNFVVRNVKAKLKELNLKDMLKAWNMQDMADELGVDMNDDTDNPKIPLEAIKDFIDVDNEEEDEDDDEDDDDDEDREEVNASERDELMNQKDPYDEVTMPSVEITTLAKLGEDCEGRSNAVPRRAVAVGFAGGIGDGYDIVKSSELIEKKESVMKALQNHGCLVVDLLDENDNNNKVKTLDGMWKAANEFFDQINSDSNKVTPPEMTIAKDAGSRHAAVGYATYENGAMQFLETRLTRRGGDGDSTLVPNELSSIISENSVSKLIEANVVLVDVGKKVAKIALVESLLSSSIYKDKRTITEKDANTQAQLLLDELVDDATNVLGDDMETKVSMSPHRMCRYTGTSNSASSSAREVFGAHTDTSFVTVVPCAAVSGLEIYDAQAKAWIRPELMARRHWENERLEQGKSLKETPNELSWHSRYVVCVPGELLQLLTNNSIRASVHRVVAATAGDKSRISAPVLLRARPKVVVDVAKYYQVSNKELKDVVGPLLASCDGQTMEQIHDGLQPQGVVS